jgi:hypothetical protein
LQLVKHNASVRCLDLSASRNKLAVVDENAAVLVFNLITKEKIFEVGHMGVCGAIPCVHVATAPRYLRMQGLATSAN